jgi:predicted DCC family thiol-disulfide oxidoreductase YuxK
MKHMNEIIIFDGECFICNRFYKWLLRNDKKNHFFFSNIQSKFYSKNSNIDKSKDSIIVLINNNKILYESEAVAYIFRKTKTQLAIRILISILPKLISNFFYRIVAKNRYKIFGQKEKCYIPTEKEMDKFIS